MHYFVAYHSLFFYATKKKKHYSHEKNAVRLIKSILIEQFSLAFYLFVSVFPLAFAGHAVGERTVITATPLTSALYSYNEPGEGKQNPPLNTGNHCRVYKNS